MSKNSGSKAMDTSDVSVDSLSEFPVCGVIMPIAKTEGYNDSHWSDVYSILCEVANDAGFNPNLVSFDDDVGIIHKRIVHNIYSNPIVICDISSRNANVMLELGMRLAFDKPTIIVKDNKTPYSFDIAAIEHLEYPSDLRYQLINEFKVKLKNKIIETHKRASSDPEFTTFLKHFGTFKVAKLDEKEVTSGEYLATEVRELKELVMSSIVKNNQVTVDLSKGKVNSSSVAFFETLKYKADEEFPSNLNLTALSHYLNNNGFSASGIAKGPDNKTLTIGYIPSTNKVTRQKAADLISNFLEGNLN